MIYALAAVLFLYSLVVIFFLYRELRTVRGENVWLRRQLLKATNPRVSAYVDPPAKREDPLPPPALIGLDGGRV